MTLAAADSRAETPDEPLYDIEIPSSNAADALNRLAEQTGAIMLFPYDLAEDRRANRVVGRYTLLDALDLLLKGTGLSGGLSDKRAIEISLDEDVARKNEEGDMAGTKTSLGRKVTGFLASIFVASGAGAQETAGNQEDKKPLEEIVVTGTHIRGVESVGSPSMTFTREALDATGFSTVGELFEDLPQNLHEISQEGAFNDGASRISNSNTQGVTSISLRGLGPSSTLVLLNGKRRPGMISGRVFDVSAIPLSMVEGVEIVTGGRSAVYGSDAVAGVVNLVTRTEFDGAETQVYYGEASAGGERFNFSQTFGRVFERGGFVFGYDYSDDQALDATDAGAVRGPSRFGATPIPGLFWLRVPSEQHVGMLSGHYKWSDKAELYADAHFSSNKNITGGGFDIGGALEILQVVRNATDQYSASGGVRLGLGEEWQVDISALHGVVDTIADITVANGPPGTFTSADVEVQRQGVDDAKLTSFSAIADGPIGKFGNGTVSAAIGVEHRKASFQGAAINPLGSTPIVEEDLERDVQAVFAELHWPLLYGGGQRFEVSVAGRYDDYSDFGDTFNPQYGIEWEPLSGLTLRGSYSEAFRAPPLFTLAFGNQVLISIVDDPSAPGTPVTMFSAFGGNADLQPEIADTWTFGIDWEPSDRAELSFSYYAIESSGRIDQPADNTTAALQDEALFASVITRNPTPQEVADVLDLLRAPDDLLNGTGVPFDPATDDPFALFSNILLFDNRRSNIGLEAVDGLDFDASTRLETSSGDWSIGLNATYVLDFERNITPTAPPIDQVNRPGRPADLRLRGHLGWSGSAWDVNAYVNYVDSYEDTFATTPTEIESWTTVDVTVRFDASGITDSRLFNGFEATLGLNNAFDAEPPVFLNNTLGIGYDTANASALGRFVSLRLAKSW